MSENSSKITNLGKFVGNTPLVVIDALYDDEPAQIYAKYEAWNYSGSIKDRMVYHILKAAYENKVLNPKDTLVEATSGNTGIALAAMGAYLGHPVEIYMPNWLSDERKRLLRFYGAKLIEISEKKGGFIRCIELAAQKSDKKGYFGPKQFKNVWNVFAHYTSTAPEIENTLNTHSFPELGVFVAGVGTGGTIMGVKRYFSEKNTDFRCIPVLPQKNQDAGHRIEGIGDSFIPEILNLDELSPIYRINDSDAIITARKLNKAGLSVGISSGANVFAALKASIQHPGVSIATVLCDDSKKYLTTDLCSNSSETESTPIKILDFKIVS